jgi:mannose-6-phosphate isomerase-like protein (cupin superfamily)
MEITEKVWGTEKLIHNGQYAVKILIINPGKSISLQYHCTKTETMMVVSGSGLLTIGEDALLEEISILPMTHIHIPPMTIHTVKNTGKNDLVIFEASTPELEDVVRLELYG